MFVEDLVPCGDLEVVDFKGTKGAAVGDKEALLLLLLPALLLPVPPPATALLLLVRFSPPTVRPLGFAVLAAAEAAAVVGILDVATFDLDDLETRINSRGHGSMCADELLLATHD